MTEVVTKQEKWDVGSPKTTKDVKTGGTGLEFVHCMTGKLREALCLLRC